MQGLVADESAHLDPDAKRRAVEQVGCHCRCRPLCWRVVGLREWWPVRRDSVAEAERPAEDTIASEQLSEVGAGS